MTTDSRAVAHCTSDLNELHTGAIRRLAHLHKCAGGVLWLRREGHYAAIAPCRMPLPTGCTEAVDTQFSRWLAAEWIIDLDAGPEGDSNMPAWLDEVPELGITVPLLADRELIGFIGLQRSMGRTHLNPRHLASLATSAREEATQIARAQA